MKKTVRIRDDWGQIVIYVEECEKFLYEFQKDMPKLNKENMMSYIKRKNAKIKRNHDIMYLVENYYNNNWGDRYN